MILDVQFRIKNNPMYQNYLRENSYWYKVLSRNPDRIKEFEDKAKEHYGARPTDKIGKLLSTMEMINSIVSTLK
ncbi:MAG: YlbE-like family protein [Bacilli bacterium]|nr:YlbE-like family protein [Bacilli bacterium]